VKTSLLTIFSKKQPKNRLLKKLTLTSFNLKRGVKTSLYTRQNQAVVLVELILF